MNQVSLDEMWIFDDFFSDEFFFDDLKFKRMNRDLQFMNKSR